MFYFLTSFFSWDTEEKFWAYSLLFFYVFFYLDKDLFPSAIKEELLPYYNLLLSCILDP